MELKKTLYFRSVSGKTEEGETEESLHVGTQTNVYHKKMTLNHFIFSRRVYLTQSTRMYVVFLHYYLQS